MTDSGPLVTGFHNALSVLVLPLIENRFWTLLKKDKELISIQILKYSLEARRCRI